MNAPTHYYTKYKHLKEKIGVYKIQNTKNGKIYIGSTCTIGGFTKRFCEHIRDLLRNRHMNIHLQHSFNLYGIDVFEFSVVEECSKDKSLDRENFYIGTLSPEYNIMKDAKSPGLGRKGKLNAHSKLVMCINDNLVFESQHLAAQHYGIDIAAISKICHGGRDRHTQGLCFHFVGDEKRKQELVDYMNSSGYMRIHNGKEVYCVNNQKTYANSKDASEELGLRNRDVRMCLERRLRSVHGYCFCRPEEKDRAYFLKQFMEKDPNFGKRRNTQPIERSDGKQYNSYAEAAQDLSCRPNSVAEVLNGRKKSIRGFTFRKLDIPFVGYTEEEPS